MITTIQSCISQFSEIERLSSGKYLLTDSQKKIQESKQNTEYGEGYGCGCLGFPRSRFPVLRKETLVSWLWHCGICSNDSTIRRITNRIHSSIQNLTSFKKNLVKNNRYHYKQCVSRVAKIHISCSPWGWVGVGAYHEKTLATTSFDLSQRSHQVALAYCIAF